MPEAPELKRGVFILSLDIELAWGTRGNPKYLTHYRRKRAIADKLLTLLDRYGIKATWAMVGHLFLDACAPAGGVKHPEIVRPQNPPGRIDWFDVDPTTDAVRDEIWYGKDIVEKILRCATKQEIGCHTFSHIRADDPGTSEEWFDSELKECARLAASFGLALKSFVFPENRVAKIGILRANGFKCYRGRNENWYENVSGAAGKLAHLADNYLALPARAVEARDEGGIWNLPGSYFYVHKDGWASWLPVSFRVKKTLDGIKAAIEEKKIFHLWFHPFNLASDEEGLLAGLEEIFAFVDAHREKGLIDNLTMGETAEYLNSDVKVEL